MMSNIQTINIWKNIYVEPRYAGHSKMEANIFSATVYSKSEYAIQFDGLLLLNKN
jgi:hypothetical protein